MITVKLSDILNSEETLKKCINISMKGKLAYQIARIAREVEKETALFETERNKLVEKYAERDENNNFKMNDKEQIYIDAKSKEKIQQFTKELNDLIIDTEVELNVKKIKLEDLTEQKDFTPKDFNNLMPFIEE